jgi:hypothetical protein
MLGMKTDLSDYLRTLPEGTIAVCTEDGLGTFDVKEFIDQPWEGILWDLNRDAATCLTNLKETDDLIWINNYASGQVIRALKERIAELEKLVDL